MGAVPALRSPVRLKLKPQIMDRAQTASSPWAIHVRKRPRGRQQPVYALQSGVVRLEQCEVLRMQKLV